MKLRELLSEGLIGTVDNVVSDINKKFNKLFGINTAMFSTKSSNRMWTRGDGSRYKEPSYIYPAEETYIFKKYPETAQKFDGTKALTDFAWKHIISLPGAKSIGKIKGEFGSSEYSEAYQVGKIIFIRDNFVIRFATTSILKNVDVWTKENESLEETATAGATSAGNIASVPNPTAAHSKPKKKGKYGAPQAPQRKNSDGTAKNALDVSDTLMGGGKTIKR